MVKIFIRLGEREAFRSELFRVETPSTWSRSGLRIGSYVRGPAEMETRGTAGSLQVVGSDKSVKEPSNQNAKLVASDGNLPGHREHKRSKKEGHRL